MSARMGQAKRALMIDFFARNPGEELSIEDAAQKFDLAPSTAAGYLANLAGDGELERVSVYRRKGEGDAPKRGKSRACAHLTAGTR